MRTTLALADDVLVAAKAIASAQNRSVGDVISELARRALHSSSAPAGTRNGLPLLPLRAPGTFVSLDVVNELRDEEP